MEEKIIYDAFIEACKYLQYHPPAAFGEDYSNELKACVGAATYKDGWKQWAYYFLDKVSK